MKEIQTIAASANGAGKRFAVVASRFNEDLVDRLITGAIHCLIRQEVAAKDLRLVRVPGAWEIPVALEELAAGGGLDGLVALGVILRGETAHFDHLCAASSRGVASVARRYRVAIGFGILTCEDAAQAEERAGGSVGNRGEEAALAAIEMANLLQLLRRKSEAM